jgi:hypothetical protein
MTAKLRLLGVTWLDQPAGKHVGQLYALLLATFVVWAGFRVRAMADRDQPSDRLHLVILWLAILNLASLGGPFVPVMYGTVGTLWILALLAADAESRSRFWNCIALLVVMTAAVLVVPTPQPKMIPAVSTLILSLIVQAGVFGVNLWAAARWVGATRTAHVLAAAPVEAV